MDPRIWKSHLVDKLTVLIIHAHHDEDAIVKVAVWDAFWADVKISFLGHIGCSFLSFVQKQRKQCRISTDEFLL